MEPGEQYQAYLTWLRERGLRHPVPGKSPPRSDLPAAPELAAEVEASAAVFADPAHGYGNRPARVLFLGDGGDAEAMRAGSALAGEQRQLLDKMIAAMHLAPTDVYVTNASLALPQTQSLDQDFVKTTCQRLHALASGLSSELVVIMGPWTARLLLGEGVKFQDVHGRITACAVLGLQVLVTYHPRDLLRVPADKRLAWRDLQVAMSALGLTAASKGS